MLNFQMTNVGEMNPICNSWCHNNMTRLNNQLLFVCYNALWKAEIKCRETINSLEKTEAENGRSKSTGMKTL